MLSSVLSMGEAAHFSDNIMHFGPITFEISFGILKVSIKCSFGSAIVDLLIRAGRGMVY